MPDTQWTQPTPREVIEFVLQVIEQNPERHNQRTWVDNVFTTSGNVDAKEALKYAFAPIPETPENPDTPYCGTTGCVAGWAVAYGSEPGTILVSDYVNGYYTRFPDGTQMHTADKARELMGLNRYQEGWLFDEYRTRDEVTTALRELLEDPDADISGEGVRKFTVKVTDADGNEVYATTVYTDRDVENDRYGNATVLYEAYRDVS